MPKHESTQDAPEHDGTQVPEHVRTTFVLPTDLHRRFRVALAFKGESMQAVLEAVVTRYVELAEKQQ